MLQILLFLNLRLMGTHKRVLQSKSSIIVEQDRDRTTYYVDVREAAEFSSMSYIVQVLIAAAPA